MALTDDEQELFDLAARGLPTWYSSDDRANEYLGAVAKMFGSARIIIDHWLGQLTLIQTATVDPDEEPDWLEQHARDRGTHRQNGESDGQLIFRLRNFEDLITRPALLAAAQAMVDAASIVGTVAMVEFPRDLAYFGTFIGFGSDGAFTIERLAGDQCRFTPEDGYEGYPRPPFQRAPGIAPVFKLTISTGGGPNDGTFTITGLDGDSILYDNPTGVDDTVAPDSVWSVERYEVGGVAESDGWARAYFGRGYRMGRTPPQKIIVILPYDASEALAASVREMLRQKAAGGIRIAVERRTSP
jgi:hypothetical protein